MTISNLNCSAVRRQSPAILTHSLICNHHHLFMLLIFLALISLVGLSGANVAEAATSTETGVEAPVETPSATPIPSLRHLLQRQNQMRMY